MSTTVQQPISLDHPDLQTPLEPFGICDNPSAMALAAIGMLSLADMRQKCSEMLRRIRKCPEAHTRNQTLSCHQHTCEYCAAKRMEALLESYQQYIETIRATTTSIAFITAYVPGNWQDTPESRASARATREKMSDGLSSLEARHGKRVFQIAMIDRVRHGKLVLNAIAWSPTYYLPASQIREGLAAQGIVGRVDVLLVPAHKAEQYFRKLLEWSPPSNPAENAVLEYLLQGTHQIQARGKEIVQELFPNSTYTDVGNNSSDSDETAAPDHHHAAGTCPECGKKFTKVSNWCKPGEQPTEWYDIPDDEYPDPATLERVPGGHCG